MFHLSGSEPGAGAVDIADPRTEALLRDEIRRIHDGPEEGVALVVLEDADEEGGRSGGGRGSCGGSGGR